MGSICLSDIPREVMKKVMTRNGEKVYVSVYIGESKTPATFGDRTYTHYVSCGPRREERKEGVNYFIGDLMEYGTQARDVPSPEEIGGAPSVGDDYDLPF